MSIVLNIAQSYPVPASTVAQAPKIPAPSVRAFLSPDSVSISAAARALNEAIESSSLRLAKIRAVRAEIEEGTYESYERLEATASRILDLIV